VVGVLACGARRYSSIEDAPRFAYPGGNPMKMVRITSLALIIATPAVAAPQWVEDLCWSQAAEIRFNGRGEREAFIANCIADHTPRPSAERRYKRSGD